MKEWYYMESDKPYKKFYFDSYADARLAILCVYRYKAPTNEVPDYTIYHNEEPVETFYGDMLTKMYVENGGRIYEDCINKGKENREEDLSKIIEGSTNSLKNLLSSINRLNDMLS